MAIPNDLSKLKLVFYPAPILRKKCTAVENVDEAVRALAARMIEIMHEHKGVGLAASQVGVSLRVFVCNPAGEPGKDLVYVNPTLSDPEGVEEKEEGCLSIPEAGVMMRRAVRITVDALDLEGHRFRETAETLLARIWQHEHDHLAGRLIIDNMSETDEIANRRVIRQLKADYDKGR